MRLQKLLLIADNVTGVRKANAVSYLLMDKTAPCCRGGELAAWIA